MAESLPEEMWIKIFEIGVRKGKLYLGDLYSISVTCKLLNKLWSEDSIWSVLLALDSPSLFRYDETALPEAYSSCNQALYKCRLGRLLKSKFAYIETKIEKKELRMSDASDWVNFIQEKLSNKSYQHSARIHRRIGMRDQRLKQLSKLLASGIGKGDRVIALCRRTSFALGTPLANTHSSSTPVDSLVGLEKKIDKVLSVMRDKVSKYYRKKDVFCTLLRNQLENFKQLVVLTSRLAYLSSGSNPIETGGFIETENDYYSTDDDDDDDDDCHYDYDFCHDITDDDHDDDDDSGDEHFI